MSLVSYPRSHQIQGHLDFPHVIIWKLYSFTFIIYVYNPFLIIFCEKVNISVWNQFFLCMCPVIRTPFVEIATLSIDYSDIYFIF